MEVDRQALVANFVLKDGGWNWQCLLNVLLARICEYIASIAPPSCLGYVDSMAWLGSHDGEFSIRSAYSLITRSLHTPVDLLFRLIWK